MRKSTNMFKINQVKLMHSSPSCLWEYSSSVEGEKRRIRRGDLPERAGEVGEGAITNLFVEEDGRLLRPPASCGLPGGIRRSDISADRHNRAVERVLHPEDPRTCRRILLPNSVRGIVPVVPSDPHA